MPLLKQKKSKKIILFSAILLASLFLVATLKPSQALAACSVAAPTTAAEYQQLLRDSSQNGRWYHGDAGQSVRLPDGRDLWVFGDTLSGTVSNGTQNWGNQFINNTAILVEAGCSTVLMGANDANGNPTAWIKPTGALDIPGVTDYYWSNTPFVDGSTLRVFLTHMYNDANGAQVIGTDLATFDISGVTPVLTGINLTPSSLTGSNGPTYGAAVIQDGGYTYIYGNRYMGQTWVFGHDYYLARVPNGDITNLLAWKYWDGSAWSSNPTSAAIVISGNAGIGSGGTVYANGGGGYTFVSKKYDFIGTDLIAWHASSLTGPWTESSPALLAPVPDATQSGDMTYLGLAHKDIPLASSSGNLLVSWSLNSSLESFFGSPRYGIYLREVAQP